MDHNLVADIAMCVSLCPSVTAREYLSCREQLINVVRDEEIIWTIFGRSKVLDIFGDIFGLHWP